MPKLYKEFTIKDWENCCGSFCDDCKIACRYRNILGKKKGKKKFKKERKKVREKLKL